MLQFKRKYTFFLRHLPQYYPIYNCQFSVSVNQHYLSITEQTGQVNRGSICSVFHSLKMRTITWQLQLHSLFTSLGSFPAGKLNAEK